jgi:uncharacterized protein YndB with AHSA1/START domain
MSDVDKISVSVFVAVPVEDAFAVFTEEIDQWWRRGPAYRLARGEPGTLHCEPRLGGKLIERAGSVTREIATITAWEPPRHLVFEWRAYNFREGEVTTVELWFEAGNDGTRVRLEHRGWSAIPQAHPVRHGQPDEAFLRTLGMWWGGLLTSFREHGDSR